MQIDFGIKFGRSRWARTAWPVLLTLATVAIVGAALFVADEPWPQGGDLRRSLTKPVRLEQVSEGAFTELLLGLRTYHYRAQPQGVAFYSDVYYDTDQWDLFHNGYSYRFRGHMDAGELTKSVLLIEQEPRFVSEGSKKLELRSELPNSLGSAIIEGEWGKAVLEGRGLEAVDALHGIAEDLGVKLQDLRPQLVADLRRERFDITDKGQNWFELDHEAWSFRLFADTQGAEVAVFEDLVLDTTLNKRDPELIRRVRTLTEFLKMVNGVRPAQKVPHERAIGTLVGS